MRPPSVTPRSDVTDPPNPPAPPPRQRKLSACVRRPLRFVLRRPKAALAALVLLLFFTANVLAYVQAYSLTHFVQGVATTRPDHLSLFGKVSLVLTGVRLAKPANTMTPATFNLPYETHRYRGADGTEYEAWRIPAGGPVWRRWRGSRGTVVMFHGYAGCKASLLREAAVVRQAGYDAFLVDFRGCGGSSGSVTTVGYREADDVAEAFAYVKQKLGNKPLVIYGRSMGAAAALRAVSLGRAHPDALVLESPFDSMFTTVAHRFDLVGVPTFPLARLMVFWGGVQQGYWGFAHNPRDYAHAVQCPTLMIRAGCDPFVRKPEAESIFNAMRGPKQLVVFDKARHEPCVEVDPGKWTRKVTDFLLAAPRSRS
jgi:alpha-beta hydrolase superfamily lysophospholipase